MYVHDRSYSTVAILRAEMRVIPTRAVLGSAEAIHFRIARRQSALSDSVDLGDPCQIRFQVEVSDRPRLTPSSVFECNWRIPCQWNEVPLCCILLRIVISKVSPQFPMMVGPGIAFSMRRQTRSREPSGLQVVLVTEKSYLTTRPVSGQELYISVVASNPGSQHCRLFGPCVQLDCFLSRAPEAPIRSACIGEALAKKESPIRVAPMAKRFMVGQ
jgi:hypothetical protein